MIKDKNKIGKTHQVGMALDQNQIGKTHLPNLDFSGGEAVLEESDGRLRKRKNINFEIKRISTNSINLQNVSWRAKRSRRLQLYTYTLY